jgi:hypothetical protein
VSTYTDHLHLAKPAQGDTDWATEINVNRDCIDHILASHYTYYVASTFTQANLFTQGLPTGNERRHFDTIQGAVDEAEAKDWGNFGYAILIAPGTYNEKVTVKKPVSLVNAAMTSRAFFLPASVKIRGNGNAEPVILAEPQNSEYIRLGLFGLQIDNRYSTNNATEITEPYALWLADQAGAGNYGAQANTCTIQGCCLRMQPWGEHNKWLCGVRIRGWWQCNVFDTQVIGLTYAGGHDDGYIRRLWDIYGDVTEPKTSVLNQFYCQNGLKIPGSGSPPSQYTYALLGRATVALTFTSVEQTSALSWTTSGSNNTRCGFADTSPDDLDWRNSFSNWLISL